MNKLLVGLLAVLLLTPLHAEVLDKATNGFTISHSVVVDAERAEAYGIAVDNFHEWWNADHSISGVAENLYIVAEPGGCFCEKLGPESGLIHLNINYADPGSMLRFSGGLGPLGLMGVNGAMTWEFTDDESGGTRMTLVYAVGGYMPGGLDTVAEPVNGVLVEALENYKARVNDGINANAAGDE